MQLRVRAESLKNKDAKKVLKSSGISEKKAKEILMKFWMRMKFQIQIM